MIKPLDAYKKVVDHVARINQFIEPYGMIEGKDVYLVKFRDKDDHKQASENQYVIDKTNGKIRSIFVLSVQIEYPDFTSWPEIDITKFNQRAS